MTESERAGAECNIVREVDEEKGVAWFTQNGRHYPFNVHTLLQDLMGIDLERDGYEEDPEAYAEFKARLAAGE
jgi:hypothetical protein